MIDFIEKCLNKGQVILTTIILRDMSIYPELSYNEQKIDIQEVKGIQFSVLGPDEIIKRSVVEVNKTDTYAGSEPIIGGLFDSRMGVLEHNRICSTCEQKNIFCPGHFGHIVLAKPVFHAMFFDIVKKILNCICYKCSKILISPETTQKDLKNDMQKIMMLKNNQKRWEAYFKLCNTTTKIRSCGDDGTCGCGAVQPTKYNKENAMKIIAEWKDKKTANPANSDANNKITQEFTADDILKIFKRISEKEMEIMGFNPQWNRPEWMICTVLPVPPPAVRPSIIEENGQRREDDLTHKLSDIIKTNNSILDKMNKGASEETIKYITMLLQYHIFTFIDNQIPGLAPSQQRNGRKLKSVSDRMKKKEGRIRGNLNGKRVDQSARSVITPDPYISIDELGVPIKVAINITFPEVVNQYNLENMRTLIKNGSETWPGAKYVKKLKETITINLKYADLDKVANELKYGDIVHRHLSNGDFVLFNRQPSLHKMSMMCHKVVIMPYQTFRLNVLDTPPYNADFDGDEMNLHCPQNIQTMNELMDIAAVPYMILAPRDGKPIIEVVQDTLLGAFRLTKDATRIQDKTMANLQMVNSYFSGTLPEPNKHYMYTGKEAYSQILPPGLFINRKNKKDEKFIVDNSQLVSGTLDKTVFHGITTGILPVVYHDYGPFEVRKFLDNTQRLICRWLLTSGFSVGISDLVTDSNTDDQLKNKIKEMKLKAYNKLDEIRRGMIDNNSIFNNEEYIEREIIGILNETTSEVGKIGLSQIDEKTNRMINMVKSGSKGKETNVAQMIACVGQQNVDGKRITYGFTDRTLPHFTKYDDGPEARGFVENSFISGLSPQEVFFHAMGGREGLIDTAVKSVTGDTPIIVIEDGEAKTVNIGDWIDAKIDDPANKHMVEQFGPEDANMEMLGVPDGIYIPTCDDVGNVMWGKLTNVSRHDPGETLFEVKTQGGRSTIVTASKSLILWKNGKFQKTFTPLAQIGDCLPVTMNMPKPPVIHSYVDMSKYFPKNEYIHGTEFHLATRLMKEAQGDKFHIPRGWWEKNNGITFITPYPEKAKLQRAISGRSNTENIREGYIYPYGATRCHSHLPDKFELNKENGIFIGLFLADGNARDVSGSVAITKEDEDVRNFARNWFDKFGITHRDVVKIVEPNDKGIIAGKTTTLVGNSSLFARFLDQFVGTNCYNKYVPNIAYTAPDEFVEGIIIGYFSGDGTVDSQRGIIQASSASYKLIEGISHLCSRLGIFGRITKCKPKTTNIKDCTPAEVNTITIRVRWAKIFAEKITLIEKNKNARLKSFKNELKSQFKFDTQEDVVLDPITEIRVIPKEDFEKKYKKVYDVSVPETGHFGTANGCVYHNTSETGYIQRRLVKAMEDAKIYYDNTVRTAVGSIIQFIYGEDGMDGCKIETQMIPTIDKEVLEIDHEYHLKPSDNIQLHMTEDAAKSIDAATYKKSTELFDSILDDKYFLIKNVFNGEKNKIISYPIPFDRIINTAVKRIESIGVKAIKTDLTPNYIFDKMDKIMKDLYIKDTEQGMRFFHILLRLHLCPKKLIIQHHFTKEIFDWIVEEIYEYFNQAIAQPGEMVGIVAAQTIGEMGTQMTLDSFHVSGTAAAVKATSGVPRLKEILSATKKTKTPTLMIYMKADVASIVNPTTDTDGEVTDPRLDMTKSHAMNIKNSIEITKLADILDYSEIYWDSGDKYDTHVESDKGILQIYKEFEELEKGGCKTRSNSPWVLRLKFNKEKMNLFGLKMIDIYTKLNNAYDNYIDCVYSDDNAEECIFRIKLKDGALKDIDSKDEIAAIKAMEHNIVYQVLLKGYKGIKKVSLNKKKYSKYNYDTNKFDNVIEWVLDTDGTNLVDILANPNIDATRTISNDIREIYETLGIEAARNSLYKELVNVTSEGSMNYRHMSLLIDTMTYKGQLMSIDRHGINRGDIGPLAKSSFEETTDMLINASIFAEYDKVNGVSANVMLGQQPPCGTGDSRILLDEEHMLELMKDMTMKEDANTNDLHTIEEDEEDNETCLEDDLAFNFKLNQEPSKCFNIPEQKLKIV
jgi:DNA-directed RNA polymerase beta' subunit